MAAVQEINPSIGFEIFTLVPQWFFEQSNIKRVGYHAVNTDIGLVQKTPLKADLPATIVRLDEFLPFKPGTIAGIAKEIENHCRLIICDISPLGIAIALELGIPSILIENFTWDWLYQGYRKYAGSLKKHIRYLRNHYDRADYHVQTEPLCHRRDSDLVTAPVSRKRRTPGDVVRGKLNIPSHAKVVLVTMGGISENYSFIEQLSKFSGIHFVIPGAGRQIQILDNVIILPPSSPYFHPDLVHAADAVIGKAGYSTLAEVFCAGVPFGYIERRGFRESRHLVAFIEKYMNGRPIEAGSFYKGGWLADLNDIISLPRIKREGPNGADQIARFIIDMINREN
ncbi:hypothetical protein ACFL9T_09685 [Thermodesulfobacteriota bacterium]